MAVFFLFGYWGTFQRAGYSDYVCQIPAGVSPTTAPGNSTAYPTTYPGNSTVYPTMYPGSGTAYPTVSGNNTAYPSTPRGNGNYTIYPTMYPGNGTSVTPMPNGTNPTT